MAAKRVATLALLLVLSTLRAESARAVRHSRRGNGEAQQQQRLDVWVLAGQSNMEGQNARDGQQMPECGTPWPAQILSFPRPEAGWTGDAAMYPTSQWIPAEPNTCVFASQHRLEPNSLGPEMAFAKTLINAGAAQRIGFVPLTAGGSSLYQDWAASWSQQHGLLALLLAMVRRAMEAAQPNARLAGMIWVQGEGDATIAAGMGNANWYEHNLAFLFHTIRQSLVEYHPVLPIIMSVQATSERDRVFPYIHLVRQQQLNFEMPALIKVDMEGFEMMADNFTDIYGAAVGVQKVHITKRGQCAFGEAIGQAYLAHEEELARIEAAERAMAPMR